MKKLFLTLFLPLNLIAQDYYSFNHNFYDSFSQELHLYENTSHTAIKPFLSLKNNIQFSVINTSVGALNRFFNDNFINIKTEDFKLSINPLFDLQIGRDQIGSTYTNTRAFELKGQIGKNVYLYSSFYENQAIVPIYLEDYVWSQDENGEIDFVLPGQGVSRVSSWDRTTRVLDYAMANGHVSFQASNHFNFQFGHGKHFIGDGYRSMLLSDNAFNYPYLKITTDVWKVRYVNLYSTYQDLRDEFEMAGINRKKFSTIHYLSYNLNKSLNIGLFEAIVWEQDTLGRGFDANYINPIIFYRPIEFSLGSGGGNALMGVTVKYKLSDKSHAYGQFIIDEFKISEIRAGKGWWANKYAGQIGFKMFDLLGVDNLFFQTEFNASRPFIYSHHRPLQSYTHYGQPLAHPLGSSFYENITIARYRYKRYYAELKTLWAKKGAAITDSTTNFGFNPLQSYSDNRIEYGNFTAQGNTTDLKIIDFRVGILLNPNTNMKLEFGVLNRKTTSIYEYDTNTNHFYVAFKTDLRNLYYDF